MDASIPVFDSAEDIRMVLEAARKVTALESHVRRLEQELAALRQSRHTQTPIYLKNAEASTAIPPYACVQITGTTEDGGQNYLNAKKPADNTGAAGFFLFNGHTEIEDDGFGTAQHGPIYRAFKNSGTITAGEMWRPTASQWYLSQDDAGMFQVAGADDIDDDVLKVKGLQITDLRLSGNNLQLTFNGTDWHTWHTASTCP